MTRNTGEIMCNLYDESWELGKDSKPSSRKFPIRSRFPDLRDFLDIEGEIGVSWKEIVDSLYYLF